MGKWTWLLEVCLGVAALLGIVVFFGVRRQAKKAGGETVVKATPDPPKDERRR